MPKSVKVNCSSVIKKLTTTLFIGFPLFLTLVLPYFLRTYFGTSMANGFVIVMAVHILIVLALWFFRFRFQQIGSSIFAILVVLCFILVHATVSFYIHATFDYIRFKESAVFLVLFLLGAYFFSAVVHRIQGLEAEFSFKLVFHVLLITSIAAALRFAPVPSEGGKSVFFFNEPSHFAVIFLPFLLYMTVISQVKARILFILIGYSLAFFLENLTLAVGCTLIAVLSVPVRILMIFGPLAFVVMLTRADDLVYFTSRLFLFGDNRNLSTTVFLSGWERAYLNLKSTFGFGVGFQQFGVIGSRGEMMDYFVGRGVADLNLLDGGANAPKFIGEFGLLGVAMLLVYIKYIISYMKWFRGAAMSAMKPAGVDVMFRSWFLMYSIDLFVRGTGYFAPSGFVFAASLIWLSRFQIQPDGHDYKPTRLSALSLP